MSKKLKVDENLCTGCATCASLCPECFEIGADFKSHVKKDAWDECDLNEVVDSCPMGAISYE